MPHGKHLQEQQCWQTETANYTALQDYIDYVAAGTETIELPMNTAPLSLKNVWSRWHKV